MHKICYLHIGSPKTGSTSIQGACFKNRSVLEKQGLLYPGKNRRHNALVSAFHDAASDLRFNRLHQDLSKPGVVEKVLEAEFEQAANSEASSVLYSNELLLAQAKHLDIAGMKDFLLSRYDDVRVICYLRDPYKLLISRAQEQIKSGVRTYPQVVNRPPVLPMEMVEKYIHVYGREAMDLRDFDAVVKSEKTLLEDFIKTILPDARLDEIKDTGEKNTGLTLEAALIMSGLNEKHGLHGDWSGRHLRIGQLRGIGRTRFGLPPEAVMSVKPKLEKQYEALDNLGMNFAPPDWDNLPEVSADWSQETMEQVALTMNDLAKRPAKKKKKAKSGGQAKGVQKRATNNT